MARELSKGFILPEAGDSGRVVFDALEKNILRMNELFPSEGTQKTINLNVVSSQWLPRFPSGFQATISWTTDFDGSDAIFALYLQPSNERVFLRYKANSNNLILYTNDRNIAVKVIGLSN